MIKRKILVFTLLLSSLLSCAQEEIRLVASCTKDTITLGESVNVKIFIEGIKGDFLKNAKHKKDIFDDFFHTDTDEINYFQTNIILKPENIGHNELGPFKIQILDKELTSNTIPIYIIKHKPVVLHISMPKDGKVGEIINIKFKWDATYALNFRLKENGVFEHRNYSQSTNIVNGNISKEINYKVTLLKSGDFELNREFVENIPADIILEPIKFSVE